MQMFVVLCEIKANPRCGNIKSVNIFSLSLFELTPLQSPTPFCLFEAFPLHYIFYFYAFHFAYFSCPIFIAFVVCDDVWENVAQIVALFYVQFLPFAFDICIPCKGYGGVDIAKANEIDIKGVRANRY